MLEPKITKTVRVGDGLGKELAILDATGVVVNKIHVPADMPKEEYENFCPLACTAKEHDTSIIGDRFDGTKFIRVVDWGEQDGSRTDLEIDVDNPPVRIPLPPPAAWVDREARLRIIALFGLKRGHGAWSTVITRIVAKGGDPRVTEILDKADVIKSMDRIPVDYADDKYWV